MKSTKYQFVPIVLTVVICAFLVYLLFFFIKLLNFFPTKEKIQLILYPLDILVGFIIYIKTSVDFALFIGKLMKESPGTISRIAIESGTALGNGIGTLFVLTIWTFFKEVPILMVIMITIASLILLRLAQDGLQEFKTVNMKLKTVVGKIFLVFKKINSLFDPIISLILPHPSFSQKTSRSFLSLFMFSLTIPFVLGLDDFAGYIPLFSIVNIFGFATGIFLGHMILNLLLFASPKTTVKIVSLPMVVLTGAVVFLGLSLFGFYEAFHLLFNLFI